jgi:metabolite-proton symporter
MRYLNTDNEYRVLQDAAAAAPSPRNFTDQNEPNPERAYPYFYCGRFTFSRRRPARAGGFWRLARRRHNPSRAAPPAGCTPLGPGKFCISPATGWNPDATPQVYSITTHIGFGGAAGGTPMALSDRDPAPLSSSEHQLQLRRAVIASTIGTAIEWYDFFLYSTVTGLVFAKLFFPNSDHWVGTLEAFAIYAVGFIARPIGAAIFGHYGDRIGRKSTLIATLLLMGLATAAVAVVPTYEHIGIWGAVILTVLRFIQGVGVGGEWGGSVLMSMEWARNDRSRGLIASWPQFGVPCGLFLANLVVLAFSQMSGEQFLAWGWRIPFALSLVLVAVGLYIRLGIMETPVFTRLLAERKVDRTPMLTVIRQYPKEILLSAFARMAEQAPFYIFTAFVFSYGIGTLHVSRDFLLTAVLAASVLSFVSIPVFGHLSDQIGRKNMYMIGAVVTGVFGFIYFAMLNTGSHVVIFLAVILSLIPHDMLYGPQAALIAESFTGRLRYSGSSLGYQLASVIAGGPAPLIATWLFATYHSSYAIAIYIAICAVITLIATALMTDYTGKDISGEYKDDSGQYPTQGYQAGTR